MLISESYQHQNKVLHGSNAKYGTGGHKWADTVIELSCLHNTRDILDYGCGKSTLAEALSFPIKQYDPCIPEHSARPQPADIIVCTDVLEHVEPECIENVLDDIAGLMKLCGLIFIHTGPAVKTLPDGRNAHLIQKPFSWWKKRLVSRFKILSIDELYHGVVVSSL